MIELSTLTAQDVEALRLIRGYTAHAKYVVTKREIPTEVTIRLNWVELDEPYVKRFAPLDKRTLAYYSGLFEQGFSLGARVDGQWVGVAVAEALAWNRSLWVYELHVEPAYQVQGIGRRMVEELMARGRAAGLRIIVCETQNTNVPAIQFYGKLGFTAEGIDLSYYSNEDWPDGEVAIFMKRRLV